MPARLLLGVVLLQAALLPAACTGSGEAAIGPSLWSDRGVTAPHTLPAKQVFATADSNDDGRLSPDEVAAYAKARFVLQDRNGDGELDLQELGLAQLPAEARILPFDLDGNGRMSPDEQLTYINSVLSHSTDTPSAVVHWLDVDRSLVR